MDGLNPDQRDAVATMSGPLLVLAGAGTGKTRVVTHRIAKLIKSGIKPERILAVTFTNKAAAEMRERAMDLLGRRRKTTPEISTFHSLCVRILRRHAPRLGYPERFAIYDRGDQESLARTALREIKVPNESLRPGDLLAIIGNWKTHCIRPPQAATAAETDREHLAAMAYRRYQKALQAAGAMDFDDLLLLTEQLLTEHLKVRKTEAGRFDHVLIDEYQDTNGSQYRIVRHLAAGHQNLCVVGDDDQSIYGWRGADVSHILRFNKDWPKAKVVRLEDNYRSTEAILSLANRLIACNRNRHDKTLRAARQGGDKPQIHQIENEMEEARFVVRDIAQRLKHPSVEARDFCILFRTNEQPRAFETELRRANLPYILVGGMSFFDRKEVRDLMAYFKTLTNPSDEVSLLRIINTPPRGISQKAVKSLLSHAMQQGKPLWDVLGDGAHIPGVSDNAGAAASRFRDFIGEANERFAAGSLVDEVQDLIDRIGYVQEVERLYPDPNERQGRLDAVEEVINAVANYAQRAKSKASLRGFLDDIALGDRDQNDEKEKQLAQNAIALMTYHSAKGLEFPQVYMVGMEEGLLPHHRAVAEEGDSIDEERRLCYVGITRAQERLTMSLALSRTKWGKPRPTRASRFLFELTGQAEQEHEQSAPKTRLDGKGSSKPTRRKRKSPAAR